MAHIAKALFFAALACLAYVLAPYSPTRLSAEQKRKYGKWAVVAGASEGLGAAWAEELASQGLDVLLIARREPKLKAMAAHLQAAHTSVKVDYLALDLAAATPEDITARVLGERDVGLLVYNAAATGPTGSFLDGSLDGAQTVVDVNMRGVLTVSHVLGRAMKARGQGGAIVYMSSMAGSVGSAYVANYAASKAYLTTLAHGLSYELKPDNIDVLACLAGATQTPGYLANAAKAEGRSEFIEQLPVTVVQECLAALGSSPSVATGAINKAGRLIFTRLLPVEWAIGVFSQATRTQAGL